MPCVENAEFLNQTVSSLVRHPLAEALTGSFTANAMRAGEQADTVYVAVFACSCRRTKPVRKMPDTELGSQDTCPVRMCNVALVRYRVACSIAIDRKKGRTVLRNPDAERFAGGGARRRARRLRRRRAVRRARGPAIGCRDQRAAGGAGRDATCDERRLVSRSTADRDVDQQSQSAKKAAGDAVADARHLT